MNARERTLAIATAGVLAIGGAWSLVLDPMLTRWSDLGAKERTLEDEVSRAQQMRNNASRLKHERDALDQRLQTGDQAVVPAFLAHVRGLTRGAGFEPQNLRYLAARPLGADEKPVARGQKAPVAPFAELSFQLQARTTLDRLQSFLVDLAASDHPVRVAGLSLTPRPGGAELDIDLSLVALAPRDAGS
jgi:hypothetical protein